MPEGTNVEIAHRLSEHREESRRKRWEDVLEVVEVCLLALVAIATAWSGYQAAQWDGRQAFLYGTATTNRFHADSASTAGGQQLVANATMLTAWLQARSSGDAELQSMLVRRFTPDYRAAFDAWLKLDPIHNESAPPGPGYMPEFHNPNLDEAKRLNEEASTTFEQGTEAREIADLYVRDTVLFASILFLVAIAQRFKVRGARLATNALAIALLFYTLMGMSTRPHL
jgi:hypothetical protein